MNQIRLFCGDISSRPARVAMDVAVNIYALYRYRMYRSQGVHSVMYGGVSSE